MLYFCSVCNNLSKKELDDKNIILKCGVCNNIDTIDDTMDKDAKILFKDIVSEERPDYMVSNNIIYDNTLSRIIEYCDICNKDKEFIIFQKNPLNFKVVKLCISCKNLQSGDNNNLQPERKIDINLQREIPEPEIQEPEIAREVPKAVKEEVKELKKPLIKTTPILKLKSKEVKEVKDFKEGQKVKIIPIIYDENNENTDFNKMITSGNYEDSLFIFNDDEISHNTNKRGRGNAIIRIYNKYGLGKPNSAGINTGGRTGYTKLDQSTKASIDKCLDEIKELIVKYKYKNIYYSADKIDGYTLGTSIFKVDKDVINYITSEIHKL